MYSNAIWEQILRGRAVSGADHGFTSLSHRQKKLQDLGVFPQHRQRSFFIRRCLRRRISSEISLLHQSGQSFPVKIPDPGILLRDHFGRRVPRIPLNCLDMRSLYRRKRIPASHRTGFWTKSGNNPEGVPIGIEAPSPVTKSQTFFRFRVFSRRGRAEPILSFIVRRLLSVTAASALKDVSLPCFPHQYQL